MGGCGATCIHYHSWTGSGNYKHDKSLKTSYMMLRKPPVLPECKKGYTGRTSVLIPGFNTKKNTECRDGWIVFQKRTSNSVNFFTNWAQYKNGFGDASNFWLGNDNLYQLTNAGYNKARIWIQEADGTAGFGEWVGFKVASESAKYKLSVGKMTGGNIGNSFGNMNGNNFSAKDRDNDTWSSNCANSFKGGWWYSACHSANLNGYYGKGNNGVAGSSGCSATCIHYNSWTGNGKYAHDKSLKLSYMMMRKPPVYPECKKGYTGRTTVVIPGINVKKNTECRDGWLVFQKRTSNSVSFYTNWAPYKNGFGDTANFWLGNENLYQLTNAG